MGASFFFGRGTTLLFSGWTPRSWAAYILTCLFLVAFAVGVRAVGFARRKLDRAFVDRARRRRYVVVADGEPLAEQLDGTDPPDRQGTLVLGSNGLEEKVRVVASRHVPVQPFRLTVDLPRSLLAMLHIGLNYLLMLSIMTMNAGYFLSIVAGHLVGELLCGRFDAAIDSH